MEKKFWINAWEEGRTNFHNQKYHPLLIRNFSKIRLKPNASVLLPLCGKSQDLLFFSTQNFTTFGIELSKLAIDQFQSENSIQFKQTKLSYFDLYQWNNLSLLNGDFFRISTSELKSPVDFIFDRAALIALPFEMRKSYLEKLVGILSEDGSIFIINLEFHGKVEGGPPFSVSEKEIRDFFEPKFKVDLIDTIHSESVGKRAIDQGVKSCSEKLFLITRN